MLSYKYLLDLAIILLSTKVLGLITRKYQLPQVVGALLAGLLLGPAVFNVLSETDFILQLSELGVIVLMFTAGIETDMNELKNNSKAAFIIAMLGVIIPLVIGFVVAELFNDNISKVDAPLILQNIFIGVVLTATSVSITVETLKELGKLSTRAGNTIIAAAIIDDILGIIILTLIASLTDAKVSVPFVLLKIILFFVLGSIVSWVFSKLVDQYMKNHDQDLRRYVIVIFVYCLLLSYTAEHLFEIADITGAYMAGLYLSKMKRKDYIKHRFEITSYMLLSPIFFASIGIKAIIPEMSLNLIIFTVLFTIVAVVTKIVGCALGAKLMKFTNNEALQVGVGMVSRGEVALIVVNKGIHLGLIGTTFIGPVIIMVIFTSILTPIVLKYLFHRSDKELVVQLL